MPRNHNNLQLYATCIFVLDGPAVGPSTWGKLYANPDHGQGSIFAQDEEGNLFYNTTPALYEDTAKAPDCWPEVEGDGLIPLYRDHWHAIQASKGSPYHNSIFAAPRTVVKGSFR